MSDTATLAALLASQPQPKCAELTPCSVIAAELEQGYVKLEFAEQPAFSNHFGNIAGGFAVELIDVLISIAAYAKVRQWCPTIEIHSRFLAPAKVGVCVGEARVIKAGKSLVFLEARLWGADGELALDATAIVSCRST